MMGRNKQINKIRKLERQLKDLRVQIPTAQGMLMEQIIKYVEHFERDNEYQIYSPKYLQSLKQFAKNYIPKN